MTRAERHAVERRFLESPKGKAMMARQNARPEQKRAKAEYKRSEKGRAAARRAYHSLRERHPEKVRARQLVMAEIRAGRLQRGPCECGCDRKPQAHHDDYSRPLDVRWLCRKAHDAEHGR